MSAATTTMLPRPAWVLLRAEAWERGFRRRDKRTGELVPNVLSFRRWCRRNHVPIRKTGRMELVCPADVDRAVLEAPAPGRLPIELVTAAQASVARSLDATTARRGGTD